jgi:hypothetical protein
MLAGWAAAAEEAAKPLTLAEAQEAVGQALRKRGAEGVDLAQPFTLEAWKDAALWERLEAQVFRVVQDRWPRATVLVRKGEVATLGISFGGLGVESLCVADLDGDRQPELLFTHGWGSGIHRTELGILRLGKPPLKWEPVGLVFLHGDLCLDRVSDQAVRVCQAAVQWNEAAKTAEQLVAIEQGRPLATVSYDKAAGRIVVQAAEGLDATTRKRLAIGLPKPPATPQPEPAK